MYEGTAPTEPVYRNAIVPELGALLRRWTPLSG